MPGSAGSPHDKFRRLVEVAQKHSPAATAIAHPCDQVSLESAVEAQKLNLIDPILVGNKDKITRAAGDAGIDAANLAYILYQVPMMVCVHAAEMLLTGRPLRAALTRPARRPLARAVSAGTEARS